jgi:hypothetical protein
MLRLATTTVYTLIVLIMLAGCSGTKDKQPSASANIKLSDLIPVNPASPAKTAAFDFYTIELPAENTDRLSDIRSMLYTKPVRLTDPRALSANDFELVFGEIQMWQKTAAMLESAGAALIVRTRLILDFGQIKDFIITQIRNETKVSYLKPDLTIESSTVQSGRLVLRLSVSPVSGERGVCNFNATPALIPDISTNPTEEQRIEETVFENLAFTVEMSPSDFFLMGPASYPGITNSIGNLFFTTQQGQKIRVYTIFCSGISE